MALLDVVLASVILLVVLVPAAQLLSTSSKVVGSSRAQAIAQGEASLQLAQDRAAWTSTTSAPSFESSPSCGSAYGSTTVNATFDLYLTGCTTVSGMPLWIFQNGGWCYTDGSTLKNTGSGVPMFWVEVMVAWGGSVPPAPTTVVPGTRSVVVSSALQTPNLTPMTTVSQTPLTWQPDYGGSPVEGCPL
jgi:hypothetical protein